MVKSFFTDRQAVIALANRIPEPMIVYQLPGADEYNLIRQATAREIGVNNGWIVHHNKDDKEHIGQGSQ